jgi:hypothetical protein
MFRWIKNLIESYENLSHIEVKKKPTVYKLGKKRYIKKKVIRKRK